MPANDDVLVSVAPLPFDDVLMQLKHDNPQVKLVCARG